MSHLDEGQLHALLDGELTAGERAQAEAHLASCAECRAAYEEARAFFQEADALIAAVELPPGSKAPPLVPLTRAQARSSFNWKQVAWAATIVLALGLGWFAKSSQLSRADQFDMAAAPVAESSAAAGATRAAEKEAAPPALAQDRLESSLRAKAAPAPAASAPAPAETKSLQAMPKEEVTVPAQPPAAPAAEPARANELGGRTDVSANAAADKRLLDSTSLFRQGLDQESQEARRSAGLPNATTITRDEPVQGFLRPQGAGIAPASLRTVPMEEAVRILGGSIRLVDGMTPRRIMAGAGNALVRVVYEDPPGRELWLDQQRPMTVGDHDQVPAPGVTTLLPGDTIALVLNQGARSLRWLDQAGFRLGLTGFLPTDSLRLLARRIQ